MIGDGVSYRVETTPDEETGIITQDVIFDWHGVEQQIMRKVLHTQESQWREALISLGWTPPKSSP